MKGKIMGEPILQIKDLYYDYGNGTAALNGVSVDIYEGEKIAVIGSNGAGKSTFFLNTNGVLKPDQGEISYRGTIINKKNLKELRKNIGIVFQDADNQNIASTVMAEVGFGPMNLKLPKEEVLKRVEEALTYMNILDYRNRPPHYLSGGEKKRVSIADIIAMKSEIIASTVMAEVGFGPMNLKLPKEEVLKRVEEALTYMNILDYRNRPPHYLSGGEKKRVSIADIIAMKSEIIIFDEPTAGLDPLNAQMLEEVLGKLCSEGKTMLISTHDVDFVYRWAERTLVFCQGKIIADG